jgi:sterol 3beta-glucosyltransferase
MAVPYYADQPFWGRRLHAVGVGAPPLPRRELASGPLSERIEFLQRRGIASRAAHVGEAMRSEGGLERAADFIVRRLGPN